jgi:hypothetical protein
MKLLLSILLLGCAGVCCGLLYYEYHPGGRLNPHEWMSEVIEKPTPQDIAKYEKCLADDKVARSKWTDEGNHGMYFLSCEDPRQTSFIPIHVELSGVRVRHPGCWDIDFCIRHSEVRVTPCK